MLQFELRPEDLEREVPALRLTREFGVPHLTLAENLWNDRYGDMNDPQVLGFSETEKNNRALPMKVFHAFVDKLHLLICTTDRKYANLRRKMAELNGKPAALIVSTLSAALAATLGIAAGILTPFVAIALHGIMVLGINTVCRMTEGYR